MKKETKIGMPFGSILDLARKFRPPKSKDNIILGI
jgi:hypothetical protein